jgi:hypothetical protein
MGRHFIIAVVIDDIYIFLLLCINYDEILILHIIMYLLSYNTPSSCQIVNKSINFGLEQEMAKTTMRHNRN